MAYAYKKIIQHKGIIYNWFKNRANSKESQVWAYNKKTGEEVYVATISEKTYAIKYEQDLPQKVKDAIELIFER